MLLVLAFALPSFGDGVLCFSCTQIRQQQQFVASDERPEHGREGCSGSDGDCRLVLRVCVRCSPSRGRCCLVCCGRRGVVGSTGSSAAGWANARAARGATAWLVPWYVVWLLPLAARRPRPAAVGRDVAVFCAYVVATHVTMSAAFDGLGVAPRCSLSSVRDEPAARPTPPPTSSSACSRASTSPSARPSRTGTARCSCSPAPARARRAC